jgi:hypothetical protein
MLRCLEGKERGKLAKKILGVKKITKERLATLRL